MDALRIAALVDLRIGPRQAAAVYLKEAIARSQAMPYPYAEAKALCVFGLLHQESGDAAQSRGCLEAARAQVAALLGCHHDEIIFTSGGSEANNLALKGVFFARRDKRDHIITTRIEHPTILAPCRFLERLGARVTYLPLITPAGSVPTMFAERSRRARCW